MEKSVLIADEVITERIFLIRGKKVMLDFDLATMYGVETKQLKRQVKRNIDRFPSDFMIALTDKEFENLRCQVGTSNWGGHRHLPMAFTEQGVAMLSSVLNSKQAIAVNIQIIRVFTRMREVLNNHKDILTKVDQLENKIMKHDQLNQKMEKDIQIIFQALKKLLAKPQQERIKIGYKTK